MAESEGIQVIVNQVAIQTATAAVMELREEDTGPRPGAITMSQREIHRARHGGPAVKKPSFNWNVTDK